MGLATIADVLQAQTARSRPSSSSRHSKGRLQISRGALAVAMGFPANTPFDIPEIPAADSVHFIRSRSIR